MSKPGLKYVLGALLLCLLASGPARHTQATEPDGYPAFHQVVRKGTHNSYLSGRWGPDIEFKSSGAYQLLVDQLLHEHVRAFEFDLMRDFDAPGKFLVRHSYNRLDSTFELSALRLALGGAIPFDPLLQIIANAVASAKLDSISDDNTQCRHLEDCLGRLRLIDHALPDHEAIVIDLELKEFNILSAARRTFDGSHTIADLDGVLWDVLGPRLYTPREFLARPGCEGKDLQTCAKEQGWPSINELRGRYVVVVHANWGDNYWDWLEYASGDITRRAAFPNRGIFQDGGPAPPGCSEQLQDPWVEVNSEAHGANNKRPNVQDVACSGWYAPAIKQARLNSIFWDVANGDYPLLTQQLARDQRIARCDSAFSTANHENQRECVRTGQLIVPSDQAWSFFADGDRVGRPVPLPTNPARAIFDPVLAESPPSRAAWEHLEPGHRIYLHLGGAQPNEAEAHIVVPFQESPTRDLWTVLPSTTRDVISSSQAAAQGASVPVAPNSAVPGKGCLFARTSDFEAVISVCRETKHDDGSVDSLSRPDLTMWVKKRGSNGGKTRFQQHHNVLGDWGDLLRLDVVRTKDHRGIVSTVWFQSAGRIGRGDLPVWTGVQMVEFVGEDLSVQGIFGTNDVLFTRLQHNGLNVRAAELRTTLPERLVDLTVEEYGPSRWRDNRSVVFNRSGIPFVGVHRAVAVRGGKVRHLYTTDPYELYTSGATPEGMNYFYVPRDYEDWPARLAPLYRCRRDYVDSLFVTDRTCGGYPPDLVARFAVGELGYIGTVPGRGLVPLYGLFHRAEGDTLYTISEAEGRAAMTNHGYAGMRIVGYVWTSPEPPKRGVN